MNVEVNAIPPRVYILVLLTSTLYIACSIVQNSILKLLLKKHLKLPIPITGNY